MVDVIEKEEEYVFIDNRFFRQIKVKKNRIINCIMNNTALPIVKRDLIKKAKVLDIDSNKLSLTIEKMKNLNILSEVFYPDTKEFQKLIKEPLLENFYNPRFGRLIASWELDETEKLNRFEMFDNLKKSHICIIGVGTVGSMIAVLAASSGIGEVTIIDGDRVEIGNLYRQYFYTENQIGQSKVMCLKEYINKLNSSTKVNIVDKYVKYNQNMIDYIPKCDLIIQTGDNPRNSLNFIVNKYSTIQQIPTLFITNGAIGPFYVPREGCCFQCWFNELQIKSEETYQNVLDAAKYQNSKVFPATGIDQFLLIYYIFNDVLSFLTRKSNPLSLNTILSFEGYPCQIKSHIITSRCEMCKNA